MDALDIPLALAAGTVLALTLVSGWIKTHFWASEALICLVVGMLVGEHGLGLLHVDPAGKIIILPSWNSSRGSRWRYRS